METVTPLPEPRRLYAIGDIHGHAKLLDRMIDAIARDLGGIAADECLTVTLGDYIDRGPASRAVIERLTHNPFPTKFVPLRGNHEALLDGFLADPEVAGQWRHYGGLETLHSYGVDVSHVMRGKFYAAAAEALAEALPPAHVDFLASLRNSLTVGRYFLCHAGVRPGIALDRQTEDDLLWIRDEFLGSRANFGKLVVHGHSPVEEPEVRTNRINVDTGAFMTGRLTCVVLEDERVRFLTAF
ncbi:MAG TPA: metallophosphoesterase family protein [Stellaceae bacterium]|jgi:serine/threonine protein phosphatase 1|nr:metallophosphoesterase family protein [Stellaceae bacterium]